MHDAAEQPLSVLCHYKYYVIIDDVTMCKKHLFYVVTDEGGANFKFFISCWAV